MLADGSDFPIFAKYWPKNIGHFGKHIFMKYPQVNAKYSHVNFKAKKPFL